MFSELTPIYDAEDNANTLTCQNEFDTFISKQPANAKIYNIPFSCEGTIDMDIFNQQGRSPSKLSFTKGRINYLLNIPVSLQELHIDNNLLDQIPDGAQHLTILSCAGNKISQPPTKDFQNLVKLVIDNNKIQSLEDLPPHLEWLSASNNPELTFIDLASPKDCLYLDCRNNPNLKQIINVCQAGNKGFQLQAPPDTKIVYVDEDDGDLKYGGAGKKKQIDEEDAVANTLDSYYKLKSEYERERLKKVNDIKSSSPNASIKEKRQMLRKVPRKCLKCGKTGDGMRFWRDNDVLHAECAALQKCNFTMSVPVGMYAHINYLLSVTADDMSDKRASIIRLKMDTLFNYITETASKNMFKKELEAYQGDEAMYNTYKDYETLMIADPVKSRLIKKKTAEMWKILKEVRVMMEVYAKTGDKRMLREAVEKQVNELHPEINALRTLKHPVMKMINLDDGTTQLVQNSYLYEAADYKII